MKSLFAALAFAIPAIAFAQTQPAPAPVPVSTNQVSLKIDAYVAREVTDAQGRKSNKLFDTNATTVLPEDRLVYRINYRNGTSTPITPFVINNPVPSGAWFTGVEEAWAVVSVDGGKSFGPLASLRVRGADGKPRVAVSRDVTNVRWTLAQPVKAGASGYVQYYAVVK